MDFDAELHSLERSERSRAVGFQEQTEQAKDDLESISELWPQGAPQSEIQRLKQNIEAHKAMALVCERRADYAAEGYMYLGDDEHSDHEYMQRHGHMIPEAHSRGRAKVSTSV